MLFLKLLAAAVIGYLLGNLSSGRILSRLFGGIDIQKHGSGNPGTTNVLRTLGWLPSILTLVLDAGKACLAAWIGGLIAGDGGLLLGGMMAVVGHNWPVFYGFQGGKGIAASLGVVIMIDWRIAVALLLFEIIVVAVTRYMSVASLANCIAYPVLMAIFLRGRANYPLYVAYGILAALMALWGHRGNIRRLLNHEENRLDFSKISFLQKIKRKRKDD